MTPEKVPGKCCVSRKVSIFSEQMQIRKGYSGQMRISRLRLKRVQGPLTRQTGFMDILSDVEMRNMKQRHTAGRTLFLQNLCIRLKIILLFRMSAVWK